MAINKYLDLSTAHLTEREASMLTASNVLGVVIVPHTYGAFVNVAAAELGDFSDVPNLLAVMKFAQANDCTWINFDADGETVATLPTFSW